MADFEFKITGDNRDKIIAAVEATKDVILEDIGNSAEKNTIDLLDARTTARTTGLRQSITHKVIGDKVQVGSNIFYAPFVELGTLDNFEPPEEWEDYASYSRKGERNGSGIKPRHFLRDAIKNNMSEYKNIIIDYLRDI